ncbi:hypothetical protein ONZ51_g4267 [Trametes cubensis]|uniref:RRM domain-containing protein n=1 Tax=Trametes cubensis TaxID=1111947 RepID=A0AAD7XEU2_9APHY|nr:hypothetical protein ONZ51_g4267 [Trametes cubensis]
MPTKHSTKDRAWGTRYDTLDQFEPPSPPVQRLLSSEQKVQSPVSPLATFRSPPNEGEPATPATGPTGPDTIPHDASIFVGSLPTHFDHTDLSQRLADHLSMHPQIKTIKVSPASAGQLLQNLRMQPPEPFCGRLLRFEAAKAFRTLLISYRTPHGILTRNASLDGLLGSPLGRERSPTLPYAVRIFQPRNAKHLAVLYDKEAMKFDLNMASEVTANTSAFSGEGLLLSPLKYDEESLQRLVHAFGPIEVFKQCILDSPEGEDSPRALPAVYSYPHDAPRCTEMDKAMWEVKWRDREDSVVALLTLRRIPYLTVSWAHHPPPALGLSPIVRMRNPSQGSTWSSPAPQLELCLRSRASSSEHPGASPLVHNKPLLLPSTLSSATHAVTSPDLSKGTVSKDVSMSSAPVSSISPDDSASICSTTSETGTCWADQVAELDSYHALAPPSPPQSTAHKGSAPLLRSLMNSHLFPTTPKGDHTPRPDSQGPHEPTLSPSLIPPAGLASITARQPDGSSSTFSSREIDPRTIFVGGLDMHSPIPWDEAKLRHVFDRYGTIENIQVVKPYNKRSYFAFVTFATADGAGRAIHGEHNRVHHGHPLRVLLRERTVLSRNGWRFGRGRGKDQPGGSPGPHPYREHACSHNDGGAEATGNSASVNNPSSSHRIVSSSSEARNTSTPPPIAYSTFRRRDSNDFVGSEVSSVSSGATKVPSVHFDSSHGPPSTAASPSPMATQPSTSSATTIPSHPVNFGYFHPQAWVHPYPPPYPYSFPVIPGYTYPGYAYPQTSPMPVPPPPVVARDPAGLPSSSVSGGAVASAPATGPSKMTASGEQYQAVRLPHDGTQPPLRATGFIQNEQGTLIPVYQREALDQYMANVHGTQPDPSQQARPPTHHATVPEASTPSWPTSSYPAYPATYPVAPVPSQQPGVTFPQHQGYWYPGCAPYPAVPFPPANPQAAQPRPPIPGNPNMMHRQAQGMHPPTHPHRGGFPPRRFNRREQQSGPGGSMRYPMAPDRVDGMAHNFGRAP